MAVAALLALLLTACGQAVAGVAHVVDGGCPLPPDDSTRTPSTPVDAPVITVDDRVHFWSRTVTPRRWGWPSMPMGR